MNKNIYRTIGLISSALLIFNHLLAHAVDFIFYDVMQFIVLSNITNTLIYPLAFIGVFFAIYGYLKPYEYIKETLLVKRIILLEGLLLITKGIQFFFTVPCLFLHL
jgi:hypothetical protein